MLFPPTVGHTLQTRTVGQPVDLSPLVAHYRKNYPKFRGLTDALFARAYKLGSVHTTAQELAAADWSQTAPGKWEAPVPLCTALESEFCPIDPEVPRFQAPRTQQPRRQAPTRIQPPEQSWVEWFWSWFGF